MLDQGRRADTPVVVIENCSRPDQRILRLTLATLAHGLGPAHGPVLVMLGDAMQMRDKQPADNPEQAQSDVEADAEADAVNVTAPSAPARLRA